MSSLLNGNTSHSSLPTLSKLHSTIPPNVCTTDIAKQWLDSFSSAISRDDVSILSDLFVEDAAWRDILAFTWDYRSIQGLTRITALFKDRVITSGLQVSSIAISKDATLSPTLSKPFPDLDLFWIQFGFGFDIALGRCAGIVRLLPMADGGWKAYTVFTVLESLSVTKASSHLFLTSRTELIAVYILTPHYSHIVSHDEQESPQRPSVPERTWNERRRREMTLAEGQPSVLVIGAGHSGLDTAARLRQLGVPTLVVDKNARVGDNVRRF